jgi:hypothetical protein
MSTKDSKAAPERAMQELHEVIATKLKADLENTDTRTPALYAAAIRFLKDNGIECVRVKGSPLDKLANSLPEFPGEEDEDEPRLPH